MGKIAHAFIMPSGMVLNLLRRWRAALALGALAACANVEPGAHPPMPVRFLLSFDDGPAPSTVRVLDTLAANPVQPGIKAIFFVQTRAPQAGGSEAGRELMRRSHGEGHLLAVHSGTARGHVSHISMSREELEDSLRHACEDIAAIAGAVPRLVRPPFWYYSDQALASYATLHLAMLMTDINARDGQVRGVNLVFLKRPLIRAQLERLAHEWRQRRLPVVDGATPIVVTFHDVNEETAARMAEYLQLLVQGAAELGLDVDARPFYDRRDDLERVALLRAHRL